MKIESTLGGENQEWLWRQQARNHLLIVPFSRSAFSQMASAELIGGTRFPRGWEAKEKYALDQGLIH